MADQAYGGFWIRVLAYLVDSVVVFSAVIVLAFVAAFLGDIGKALIPLICLLTPLIYWGLMQASARQATFGKALLGMKVTDTSGNRISLLRSLGRELAKWVSGIPLGLGYVMVAFTGRKQALHDMVAATTVTRESSGHVLIALLVGVFGWIMPAALAMFIGGALIAVMMGTMGGGMLGQMAQDGRKQTPTKTAAAPAVRPVPKAAPTPPTPAPAAPAQPSAGLDTILATQLAGFEKPGTTRAGPVVLEIDPKFLFGSDFTIKTYLPPYRELRGRSIALQITSVVDNHGANLYDAANTFEKDKFFTGIDLSPEQSPVSHLAGRRKVHLKKGVDAKSVERAEGIVELNIAQNPQAIVFGRGDAGKSQAAHGVQVAMTSAKDREIQLQFGGDRSRILTTRGLDAADKPVRIESTTFSGDSSTYKFAAVPERIEVLVAESLVKRSFPFALARNSVAAPPGSAPAPAPAPASASLAAAPASTPKPPSVPVKVAAAAPEVKAVDVPTPAIQPKAAEEPPMVQRMPALPGPRYNDLMTAVMAADAAGVEELLVFGKWPDKPDSSGNTPLMVAVRRGDRDSAELLLKAGADPDRPLGWSRQSGDSAMTALLERYLRR